MNLLDHRILIWDFDTYSEEKISPIEIIEYLDFLNKSLSTHGIKLDIEKDVYDFIMNDNSIPLGDIHKHYTELVDVHSLMLSLLSQLNEHLNILSNDICGELRLNPNILSSKYPHEVNFGCKKIFNKILGQSEFHTFLTIGFLLEEGELEVSSVEDRKVIPVYCTEDSIYQILDGLGREFEMNEKHDPVRPHPDNKGLSVSVLSASAEIAQTLLILARGDESNSKKLYHYDSINEKYVVFLPHNDKEKKYHAHDIEDIPQTVKNELNI